MLWTAFVLLFISLFCPPQASITVVFAGHHYQHVCSGAECSRHFNKILASRGQQFSASPTLVERFGQFTIIVLTESILSTVSGFHRSMPGV
jgi:low temperature requirement protein LtrA